MNKRPIPSIPATVDPALGKVLQAVKEDVEILIGHRGGRIEKLPATASTDQIIAKINEIIERLQ